MTYRPSNRFWTVTVLTILIGLVGLRFVHLGADPPANLMPFGQGLLTDPYCYTHFARNAVLFGDWDLFGERYPVFKHSLVSGAAYVIFSIVGVSRWTANLTGLLLNLIGTGLFLLAVYDRKRLATTAFTALLLLCSALFFFYSRYPLLENGMICLIGGCCWLVLKRGHSLWALFLTGGAVALTALTGKLLGGLLLIPILVYLAYTRRNKTALPVVAVMGGAITLAGLYVLFVQHGSAGPLTDYLQEISDTHARSSGLITPLSAVRAVLSYAAIPGFKLFGSSLLVFGLLGWIFWVLTPQREESKSESALTVFSGTWVLVAILAISLQDYRPARWSIFLIPPLAFLGGQMCRRLLDARPQLSNGRHPALWLTVFLAIALLTSVVAVIPVDVLSGEAAARELAPGAVAIAALLTVLLYFGLRKQALTPGPVIRYTSVIVILGVTLTLNAYHVYNGLSKPYYQMTRLNRELAEITDSKAVVTGNFAPALTIDNGLRGVLEFFGPTFDESVFFDRYPVTHLLVNQSAGDVANDICFLGSRAERFGTECGIRGASIQMFRLRGPHYVETHFDFMLDALSRNYFVAAMSYAKRLKSSLPDNITVQVTSLTALFYAGEYDALVSEIDCLANEYPFEYRVQWACAFWSAQHYLATGDQSLYQRAEKFLSYANALHPEWERSIERVLEMCGRK
ncbi:MAG: hypothetical protein DRP45_07925 [Candidatus Zixiibacteriota bacterium]|nr:MAG: hypothetical protein DRP45_07925 [candidate division Zixibacteria bacterium]